MPVVVPSDLARSLRTAQVVAIIPARFDSTRLPGKPLALIAGRPLIEHVYGAVTTARLVDAVLVATDDDRVARAVDAFGGTAVMTDAHHPSGTDRLAEVASELECDIVVNVQGDEPMMTGAAIDAAVAPLVERGDEVVTTLRRRLDHPGDLSAPNVVKVAIDRAGYAMYFSRAPIPFVRPGHPSPTRWKHLGLYGYRREFLLMVAGLDPTPLERAEGLEQLRVLEHGIRILTVETTIDTIGVDTPEDLARVRQIFESRASSGLAS